jgi:hypothetical protein
MLFSAEQSMHLIQHGILSVLSQLALWMGIQLRCRLQTKGTEISSIFQFLLQIQGSNPADDEILGDQKPDRRVRLLFQL